MVGNHKRDEAERTTRGKLISASRFKRVMYERRDGRRATG